MITYVILNEEEVEEEVERMKGFSLEGLACEYINLKAQLAEIKAAKTQLQRIFDTVRLALIPDKMDDENVNSVKFGGIGTIILTSDLYARIPETKKDEALEWLNSNGLGDLVKHTVHPSTLKATVKDMIRNGETLPEDLFIIQPFTRASVRSLRNSGS